MTEMTNPLLSTAALPDFAAIRPEHVQPAIQELLAKIPNDAHHDTSTAGQT